MNVYKQAQDFTLLVERFIRSDLPEGVKPATESEVAGAMYALRAAIHGTVDTEQDFLDAHVAAHEAKYGQPFRVA